MLYKHEIIGSYKLTLNLGKILYILLSICKIKPTISALS
jgi:hypothetical protein